MELYTYFLAIKSEILPNPFQSIQLGDKTIEETRSPRDPLLRIS